MRVEITDDVIEAAEIAAEIKGGADGAVCVFDGIVRDNTRGRKTLYLDYEAYREIALEKMRGLAGEAVERFGVRDVALVHRLGRLMVGETSVLIVVASAHRGAAFDACRWLIDTLKKTVPIWKKEQFVDGAIWADGEPFPEAVALGLRDGEDGGRPLDDAHISESRHGAPGEKGDLSEALNSGGGKKSGHAAHDAPTSEAMDGAHGSLAKVEGGGGR
ncbi:molybdenum cofactor biosynthesis protein MoaE [Tunturiibacter gelidiferens]|uniref:molybdenum cofactor biosynthesis protein MoaE n=1 Tax=Tunturiibacter gelidiferens TaxID=3069689 RepID=UPI003D9B65BC